MNIVVLFKTSIRSLYRHPGRALLTVTGIGIGIAAIIITFSIGRGAEMRIKDQVMAIGENAVYIIPGNVVDRGQVRSSLSRAARLTRQDLFALQEGIEYISHVSRGNDALELLEYGERGVKERIFGTDANMLEINGYTIAKGRFFNEYEVQTRTRAVVLGHAVAENLFPQEEPIDKIIRIKGLSFKVIGVLAYEPNFWGTEDPNKRSFIPYTTGKKYFRKPDKTEDDLDFIALKIGDEPVYGMTLRMIMRTLRYRHGIKRDEQDDFTIFDQQSLATSAEAASGILQLFGLIAASISLLVGGIGIMNIMLVSVQERTQEIGVRLAVGATQSDIQLQFLLESLVLCGIGGVLGIIVGIGGMLSVSALSNLPSVLELEPLLLSFLITILVGICFGYYPAKKAAALNPVQALYNT